MSDNIKEIKDVIQIGERKFAEPIKPDSLVKNISLKTDSSLLKKDSGLNDQRKSDPVGAELKERAFPSAADTAKGSESKPAPLFHAQSETKPDPHTEGRMKPALHMESEAKPASHEDAGTKTALREQGKSKPALHSDREALNSLRTASISRKTKETDISCTFSLDGKGEANIKTGIGFFDHMLDGFTRHGLFDLTLSCDGDLYVDSHHTIEDCGIVLGQALKEAIGDKKGMVRYGSFILPMDEALVLCAVDFSGRPYLGFDYEFKMDRVGYFDTEMVREFFYAVSYQAMMNLHFDIMRGTNTHHIIEAMFKAFAKAVDIATTTDPRITDILSTKGML